MTRMNAPFDARLQYWASQVWAFLRQNDRAIDCLRAALARAPDMREGWRSIGFLYSQRGDKSEALRALEEAVRLAPDDAETRFNLGFIMHGRGDDNGAVQFRVWSPGVAGLTVRAVTLASLREADVTPMSEPLDWLPLMQVGPAGRWRRGGIELSRGGRGNVV